jgi:hypothetical protein
MRAGAARSREAGVPARRRAAGVALAASRQAAVALAAAGLLLAGGCASRSSVAPPSPRVDDWAGTLQPQGGSTIRGAVLLRTGHGQTGVSVTVAGARPGSQHPWHIRAGVCGSSGPVVGAAAAYPVLQVNSAGDASASAVLDVQLTEGAAYYVNVQRSPSDTATIDACGELTQK